MTAQSYIETSLYTGAMARPRTRGRIRLSLRTDLLLACLLIVCGLTLPTLMVFHLLPASFLLSGLAIVSLLVGGVLVLARCGEVT